MPKHPKKKKNWRYSILIVEQHVEGKKIPKNTRKAINVRRSSVINPSSALFLELPTFR